MICCCGRRIRTARNIIPWHLDSAGAECPGSRTAVVGNRELVRRPHEQPTAVPAAFLADQHLTGALVRAWLTEGA